MYEFVFFAKRKPKAIASAITVVKVEYIIKFEFPVFKDNKRIPKVQKTPPA